MKLLSNIKLFSFLVFITLFFAFNITGNSQSVKIDVPSGVYDACTGNPTFLEFSIGGGGGIGPNYEYYYTIDGAGPFMTTGPVTHSIAISSAGVYVVTECIDLGSVLPYPANTIGINAGNSTETINAFLAPTANITPDPASIGIGNNLTLNSNGAGGTGVLTYAWTDGGFGNIAPVNLTSTTFNSAAAGAYSVDVIVTDANLCTATDNITVNVFNLSATVSTTPDPAEVCPGIPVLLDATPSGGSGNYTHSWSGAPGGSLDFTNVEDPTFTYVIPGVYNLTYTVTDVVTSGTTSVPVSVTVYANPLTKTVNPFDYCAGDAGLGSLTVVSIDANTNYSVYNSGTGLLQGAVQSGAAATNLSWMNLAGSAAGVDYFVRAVDQTTLCAVDMPIKTITENPLPSAAPTAASPVCNGSTSILNANASAGVVAYSWTPIASIVGSTTIANPTANPTAPTTYTVVVTDGNACSASATVAVGVIAKPTINFNDDQGNTFEICEGQSITLTGSSTSTIADWTWSTGDLTPDAVIFPTTTNPVSVITYTLTVEDVDGCTNSADIDVDVYDQPTANAGGDEVMCDGAGVTLTATATNGDGTYGFAWSNGAGTASTLVTPGSDATYTVTVTDGEGCQHTDIVAVDWKQNPTVSLAASPTFDLNICDGESTELTATGANGTPGYTFVWTHDGSNGSTAPINSVPIALNATPITTPYEVTVYDANLCEATSTINVITSPLSSLIINNDGQSYCQNTGNVTLTANRTNLSSIWSSTDLTIIGANTDEFSTGSLDETDGDHLVDYEYTNSYGCKNSVTGTITILPYSPPNILSIDTENGPDYCDDDAGPYLIEGVMFPDLEGEIGIVENLTFSGPAGAWTPNGDGTGSLDPQAAGIGTFTFTYDVTTGGACDRTATQTVNIGAPVTFTFPTDMCKGDPNQPLTATPTGGVWKIDFEDALGNPVSSVSNVPYADGELIANQAGTYTITYTYTAAIGTGCTNSTVATCEVHALPVLTFEIGPDPFLNTDLDINFCSNDVPALLVGYDGGVLAGGGTFTDDGSGAVSGGFFDMAVANINNIITYTFTDGDGCTTSVPSENVKVNIAPTPDITGLNAAYCDDEPVFTVTGDPLNGLSGDPGVFVFPVSWTAGNEYTNPLNGTATIDPTKIDPTGTFSLNYTVNDGNGCSGTITEFFDINQLPTVDFNGFPAIILSAVNPQICKNETPITLTGSPTNANGTFSGSGVGVTVNGIAQFDPSGLAPAVYTIRYDYTNPITLCANFIEKDIEVLPLPQIFTITSPNGLDYCSSDAGIEIGVSNSIAGDTYYLMQGGPTQVGMEVSAGGVFSFGAPDLFPTNTYTVIAENPEGCQLEFLSPLTPIESGAVANAGTITGSATVCADGTNTYTYTIPVIANQAGYNWDLPVGATFVSPDPQTNSIVVQYAPTFTTGDIVVYGESVDASICPDGTSSTKTITAGNIPVLVGVPVIAGDDVVCEGETGVSYSVNTADINFETSFEWSTTVGVLTPSTGSSITIAFPVDGNGVLSVRGVNACGVSDWIDLPIIVNPLPDVSINPVVAGVITCDVASRVTLTAITTETVPPATSIAWLWTASAGGLIESQLDEVATVMKAGDYEVQIAVTTNLQTCYNTAILPVGDSKVPPALTIDAPADLTCTNLSTVTLQANAVNVAYAWSVIAPANITSATNIPNPTVDQPGTYTLKVTDLTNSCTTTKSVIVVDDAIDPNITVTNPEPEILTCTNLSVELEGSSSTVGTTLLWTGPAAITDATTTTPDVTLEGTYTLTVTNPNNGCTSSLPVVVDFDRDKPVVTISNPEGDITCANPRVILEADVAAVSNASFVWTASGGGNIVTTSGTYGEFAEVDAAGDYSVIATDPSNGCPSLTETITIIENSDEATTTTITSATPGFPNLTCANSSTINLNANITGDAAGDYAWTGPGVVAPTNLNSVNVTAAGTYTLTYSHSVSGCPTTANVVIVDKTAAPVVTIINEPYEITCTNLTGSKAITPSLTATGDALPSTTYAWTGPATVWSAQNALITTVNKTGTYTITATNMYGCTATDNTTVSPNITAPNIVVTNPEPEILTCTNLSVELEGSSSTAGTTLLWTGPAAVTDATTTTPDVTLEGTYTLTVTNPNNGCTSSLPVVVDFDRDKPVVTISNPEGDITCANPRVILEADVAAVSNASFVWTASGGGNIVTTSGTYGEFAEVDAAGDYSVIATDPSNGCPSLTETITIIENSDEATTTTITSATPGFPNLTCANSSTINLNANITGDAAGDYAWTGPGVVAPTNLNSVNVTAAGTYTLTYSHSVSGCPTTANVVIVDKTAAPVVTIINEPYEITCTNLTGSKAITPSLTATGDALPSTTYAWTGPATVWSAQNALITTVNKTGTYTITATNMYGCTATDNTTVSPNITAPNIVVTNPEPEILTCTNLSVELEGSSSTAGTTLLWTGPAAVTDATTTTPDVTLEGTYTLTVTNPNNGCTSSLPVVVDFDRDKPVVTISNPEGDITCANPRVILEADVAAVSNASFVWTASGGGNIVTTSGTYGEFAEVDAAGDYSVIATDPSNGCPSLTETITIIENSDEATTTTITSATPGFPNLTCANSSTLNLNANITGDAAGDYAWTGPGVVAPTNLNNVNVTAAGTYTLTYSHSVSGCPTTANVVIVDKTAAPVVTIINEPYEITCTDLTGSKAITPSLTATGDALPSTTYAWTGPATAWSAQNALITTVNKTGTYTITATNMYGCTATDNTTVSPNITVPNIVVTNPEPEILTCTNLSVELEGSSSTVGTTLLWTGPAAITDATTTTPDVTLEGTYTLTVTNPNNGCTSSLPVEVSADRTAATITGLNNNDGSDIMCNNTTVQLEATSSSAATTFAWSTGIGTIDLVSGANNQYAEVSGAGVYTVVATHPISGCTDTDNITVDDDYTTPSINITSSATVITCLQPTINLVSSIVDIDPTSYSWIATAGGNIVSGGTTNTATVSQAGTYTLTAKHITTGCPETGVINITANVTPPVVNITGAPYFITCTDPDPELAATVNVASTINWTGPGVTANANTLSPTVNATGTYIITAIAGNGCSATDNVLVKLNNAPPNISVDPNPEDITCATPSVDIIGNSTTLGATFLWQEISANGVSITNATSKTATVNGDGDFSFTVTAPNGCTNTDNVTVGENVDPPNLLVTAVDPEILTCTKTTVSLESSSTTLNAQFAWTTTVIGATITNAGSPTPTVNKSGIYTVLVTDPANGCTTSGTSTVSPGNYSVPTMNIAGVVGEISCAQPTIQLDATASTGTTTYSWVASNGGHILSNANTAQPIVDAAGRYTVTGTHTTTGCTATTFVDVTEDSSVPNIDVFETDPGTLTCNITTVTLEADATTLGPISINWTTSDGSFTTATNITNPTVNAPGTYVVTIENTSTGCSTVRSVTVEENIVPPTIQINDPLDFTCTRLQVSLASSAASVDLSPLSYLWTAGAGGVFDSGETTSNPVVTAVATYNLLVTDLGNGCTNTSSVFVDEDVSPPPVSVDITPDVISCSSPSIQLSGSSTNSNVSYLWTTTGTGSIVNATTTTPTVDALGTYVLEVSDLDNNCKATSADVIVFENKVNPTVIPAPPSGDITCAVSEVTLSVNSNASYSYLWSGPGTISNPNSYTTTVDATGTYTILVEDINNGCTTTETLAVSKNIGEPASPLIDNTSVCFGLPNPAFNVTSGTNVKWYGDISLSIYLGTGLSYTPTVSSVGSHAYYATSTGTNGCEGLQKEVILTINDLPDNPVTYDNEICEGLPNVSIGAVGSTIKWYDSSSAYITQSSTYIPPVSVASSGVYTYYATQTDANSCESAQEPTTYTIKQVPGVPSFVDATLEVCETFTNPEFTVAESNIKWYRNITGAVIATGNSYQATNILPGTYTYYATQTNNGCESAPESGTLTINPMPKKYTVEGGGNFCEGTAGVNVTLSNSDNTAKYELWLDETEMIIDEDGTGALLNFGSQTQVGSYSVYAYNTTTSCRIKMNGSVTVTERPLPGGAGLVSGTSSVCQYETGVSYSIDPIANATSYTWILPTGFTIVSGDNSNSIIVDIEDNAVDGNISVYASNACGVGGTSALFSVVVNFIPVPAATFSGPTVICNNQKGVQYAIAAIANATEYVWSIPLGGTIVAGHGTRQITVDFNEAAISDDISVFGRNSCGDGAGLSTFITVNALPVVSAGTEQNLCKNETVLAASSVPTGGSGIWSIYDGAATFGNILQPNTSLTNIGQGDNILVWKIVDANTCVNIDTVHIFNNKVYVNAGNNQFICSDSTHFAAMAPLDVGEWRIISGAGNIAQSNLSNSLVSGLQQDTNIFVWEVINRGCASFDSVSLFNYLPEKPSAGVDQIIESDHAVMEAITPEDGTVGTWTVQSGSGTFLEPHNPKSEVVNMGSGTNTYLWSVQREHCILSDAVLIENTVIEDPEAGLNQIICADFTSLSADPPKVGVGEWSVIIGAATFEDKYDRETKITNIGHGENWLRWSVSTSYQTVESDSVLINNKKSTEANAGPDVVLCIDELQLLGNEPIYGTGRWTLNSGSGDFADITDPNSMITALGQGKNELKWTINNDICYSEDFVTITNNTPTVANAGLDQVICFDSTALLPNTPTVGLGSWNIISGAGIFEGNSVTNLASDVNVFRYVITQGTCTSYDEVSVVNNKPTTPDAGYDQNLCADSSVFDANQATKGDGLWSIISGSGLFEDNTAHNSKITEIANGKNIFRWTISKNGCVEHDEVAISNNYIESYAGKDVQLCEDEYQLLASNPSPGIGIWSVVGSSGASFTNQNNANSMVTNLSNGDNLLRWTVTNGGCVSIDDVLLGNFKPTDAAAGEDQAVCGTEASLRANTAVFGTGVWVVMGGSGTFDDPGDPKTTISNLGVGANTLRWSITEDKCFSHDEVIITSNYPVDVFGGNDQTVCSDTANLFATAPTIGKGQWSIIKGSGNFENPTSNKTIIRNLGKGENILKWTVSSSDCHVPDTVIITSTIPTPSVAGADQILCADHTTLGGNVPVEGTGEWVLVSGGAFIVNPIQPNSEITNISLGETTLRWTISKNGCYSNDEITLVNNQPSTPFAGYDTDICGDSIRLYAQPPTVGVGRWSLVSGDAVIITPDSNQTQVQSIKFNDNTFRWTITNKGCILSDDIVITSNYEYVNAGEDMQVNTPSTQLIANKPAQGSGLWKVSASPASIETPTNFETMVNGLGSGANVFTWTITNKGCTSTDDIIVNYVVMPQADFDPSSVKGCPPMLINFINTSIGGAPYSWDFGDGETSNDHSNYHVYDEPGVYKVVLTATAPLGMTVSKDTFVTVYENPKADFDIAPKTIYIPGEHISCFNYSSRAASSQWFFGDGTYSEEYAPTYSYTEVGIYDISLKAISKEGCIDSMTIVDAVEVLPRSDFFFPDAFTPSPSGPSGGIYDPEDRSNDVFYPIIVDGELSEYEFVIYNRSGVMLFKTDNVNVGWDGYYKNRRQPQDVYVYLIRGKYNNGQPFKKTGNVLLIAKDD